MAAAHKICGTLPSDPLASGAASLSRFGDVHAGGSKPDRRQRLNRRPAGDDDRPRELRAPAVRRAHGTRIAAPAIPAASASGMCTRGDESFQTVAVGFELTSGTRSPNASPSVTTVSRRLEPKESAAAAIR